MPSVEPVIALLVEIIGHPQNTPRQWSRRLARQGIRITPKQIQVVLDHYHLIVHVGLSRLRDQRQDVEIVNDLFQRYGLRLPQGSIHSLVDSFLDGLSAIHQARTPELRQCLEQDGGYALHLDGTCECDTDVLFVAMAANRGWILDAAKISSENQAEISKLLQHCVTGFAEPLASVRDLSGNIEKAIKKVIPHVPDLICHYHFLENVGEKLREKPHSKLASSLRRLKVRAKLPRPKPNVRSISASATCEPC